MKVFAVYLAGFSSLCRLEMGVSRMKGVNAQRLLSGCIRARAIVSLSVVVVACLYDASGAGGRVSICLYVFAFAL